MQTQQYLTMSGERPQENLDIDAHELTASHFGDYGELQASMTAADEAMLDLGSTMALLSTSGATNTEMGAFLSIYGSALLRRGKLRQLCISAEERRIHHLAPPVVDDKLPSTLEPDLEMAGIQQKQRAPLMGYVGRVLRLHIRQDS